MEPDLVAFGNSDSFVDDGAADAGMAPDIDVIHEDRFGNLGVTVDMDSGRQDRPEDLAAADDAPGGNERIVRGPDPAGGVGIVEDRLRRGVGG